MDQWVPIGLCLASRILSLTSAQSRASSQPFSKRKPSQFWRSAIGACLSRLLTLHSRGPPNGLVQELYFCSRLQQGGLSCTLEIDGLAFAWPTDADINTVHSFRIRLL